MANGFSLKRFSPLKRKNPIRRKGVFPIGVGGPAKRKSGSRYWRMRAREVFMRGYRGRPCAVCGKSEGTVAHHIVPVSVCPCHCCDGRMVVVLCPVHHSLAHSGDMEKQAGFRTWLILEKHGKWQWAQEHKHDSVKRDWEGIYRTLTASSGMV